MQRSVPITALHPGQVAKIHKIVGAPEQVRRLDELGLRSGSVLEMIRNGSPCIIRVGGSKLCVRDDELLRVMVALGNSA